MVELIVRDPCIHILDMFGFFEGGFVVVFFVKDSRLCIIPIRLLHDSGFASLYGMM